MTVFEEFAHYVSNAQILNKGLIVKIKCGCFKLENHKGVSRILYYTMPFDVLKSKSKNDFKRLACSLELETEPADSFEERFLKND